MPECILTLVAVLCSSMSCIRTFLALEPCTTRLVHLDCPLYLTVLDSLSRFEPFIALEPCIGPSCTWDSSSCVYNVSTDGPAVALRTFLCTGTSRRTIVYFYLSYSCCLASNLSPHWNLASDSHFCVLFLVSSVYPLTCPVLDHVVPSNLSPHWNLAPDHHILGSVLCYLEVDGVLRPRCIINA